MIATAFSTGTNKMRGTALPFITTITPSVVVRSDGSGGRYTRLDRCSVVVNGRTKIRTAMAFGQANTRVTRRLLAGRPITLQCAWDGPVLRILGWPPKIASDTPVRKEK